MVRGETFLSSPAWLTVTQVMALSGFSRSTVYAMIRRGHLPATRPLGSRLKKILASDLDRVMRGAR